MGAKPGYGKWKWSHGNGKEWKSQHMAARSPLVQQSRGSRSVSSVACDDNFDCCCYSCCCSDCRTRILAAVSSTAIQTVVSAPASTMPSVCRNALSSTIDCPLLILGRPMYLLKLHCFDSFVVDVCRGLVVDLLMSVAFSASRRCGFVVGGRFVARQVVQYVHNKSK